MDKCSCHTLFSSSDVVTWCTISLETIKCCSTCFKGNDAVNRCVLMSFFTFDCPCGTCCACELMLVMFFVSTLGCEQNITFTCIAGAKKIILFFVLLKMHSCFGSIVNSSFVSDKHHDCVIFGCRQLTHIICSGFSWTPYTARVLWFASIFNNCCVNLPTCMRLEVCGSAIFWTATGNVSTEKTETRKGGIQMFFDERVFVAGIAFRFVNTLLCFCVWCLL